MRLKRKLIMVPKVLTEESHSVWFVSGILLFELIKDPSIASPVYRVNLSNEKY